MISFIRCFLLLSQILLVLQNRGDRLWPGLLETPMIFVPRFRPSRPSIFSATCDRAFCCIFLLFKAVFLSNPWPTGTTGKISRKGKKRFRGISELEAIYIVYWCHIMVSYIRTLLLIFSLCWPCIPNRNRSSRGQGAKGLLFWILFVLQTSKQNSNEIPGDGSVAQQLQ